MSIYTSTDKKVDELRDKIREAYKLSLEILQSDEVHDYKDEFINELHECTLDLLKIERKLK